MPDVSPVTEATRALLRAVSDAALGPEPGPHYLIIAPKFLLDVAINDTYEIDAIAGGGYLIRPATP